MRRNDELERRSELYASTAALKIHSNVEAICQKLLVNSQY